MSSEVLRQLKGFRLGEREEGTWMMAAGGLVGSLKKLIFKSPKGPLNNENSSQVLAQDQNIF